MAKNSAINLAGTRNADGFTLAGGTTERALTLTGSDVTINGSGSAVVTFPSSTSTLATLALTETLSNKSFSTAPLPSTNDGVALGSATFQFADLFLAEGGVINFDNGDLTLTQTGNNLALGGGGHFLVGGADGSAWVDVAGATDTVQGLRIEGTTSAAISFSTYVTGDGFLRFNFLSTGQMTWGSGSGAGDTNLYRQGANVLMTDDEFRVAIAGTNSASAVTNAGTQTLTNKRITRRLTTTNAPGATPTTNTDNVDVMNFTGLATAITSMTTSLSGTPTDGQLLEFRFTDNGTPRAIAWGASFASTTVTLPTTTVTSTILRVGFEYNGSLWQCISVV